MKIASVILDIKTQALDSAYAYLVPEKGEKLTLFDEVEADEDDFSIEVGAAVLVNFAGREAVGFVVALNEYGPNDALPDGITPNKLKPIIRAVSAPYFTELGARCAQFLSERYIAPLSSCVRLFTPPGGVPKMERIDGVWQLTHPLTGQVDERWVVRLPEADSFKPRKTAVKQSAVLGALTEGDLRVADLVAEYGQVNSALTALEKKGVIRIEQRRRMRGIEEVSKEFASRVRPRPVLTDDQEKALSLINQLSDSRAGEVVVLDGVTGSGKTEVYLCAIERVLEQGRSAIVLVPEISLTPQTVARFRGRFGNTVAVLHSRMSNGERFDQWDLIREGSARVVVGARSALFAPLQDVGIIIIDEEHESSYKQDQAPRYVTRDVAHWMAQAHGALLLLGSATPSLEALHACKHDKNWHHVLLPTRANGKPLPEIRIVDMSKEFAQGNIRMFSRALQKALFETIERKEKAVLLLNQRGFAQFLLCRDCGFVPECQSCSTSLTYHEHGSRLMCHHCGHTEVVPALCPKCGSPYLKRFGAGTQRVEDELRLLLAEHECEIVRMDADTTSRKGDHQRLLEKFAAADAAVLLGTQMIAKGLDFDEVTLVGVINADTMLKLPDFRSSERTFDLIEQVAGRSGRAELPGQVLVQTYSANDIAVAAAARYDREAFLDSELGIRKMAGYPPYVRLVNVLIWGKNEEEVQKVGYELYAGLRTCIPEAENWLMYPPTPCVLSRVKGQYRYHILLKMPSQEQVPQKVMEYMRSRQATYEVSVSVDVDPVNLL